MALTSMGGWTGEAKTDLNMNQLDIKNCKDIYLKTPNTIANIYGNAKPIQIIANDTAYGNLYLSNGYFAALSAGSASAYFELKNPNSTLKLHQNGGTVGYLYFKELNNNNIAYLDTSGTFFNAGGRIVQRTTTNTAYTTLPKDAYIAQTGTTGSAITIGSITNDNGRIITIKDEGGNAGTNNIWIIPQAGTIDGVGSISIAANYDSYNLMCGSPNWFIL